MRAHRRLGSALALALVLAPAAAAKLPPVPHGWPKTLPIGLTDSPGGAAKLKPLGLRYQYLAGGWQTWNPDGTFASMYVRDSWSHGIVPVLTYYVVLQSGTRAGDELHDDLAHLRDPQLMQTYWDTVRLPFSLRRTCCSRTT